MERPLNVSDVLQLANTRLERPQGVVEQLSDAEAATSWFRSELGLPSTARVESDDLLTVRRLRDSLRRLVAARSAAAQPDPTDIAVLNAASAAAPRYAQLRPGWLYDHETVARSGQPLTPVTLLLADLADVAIAALSDPNASYAECAADDCVVLFLRTDPRRRWHSERCGNRVRAARSYARHGNSPNS